MALFKIFKGNDISKLNNPSAAGYMKPTDGYAYYNTDNQEFYIDADYDGNGTISRKPINAHYAYSAGYDGAATPQRIDSTYIKNLKISNNKLTYTTGDNAEHIGELLLDSNDIKPIMSKTFTGIIGTANDWANATFFFGSIRPTNFSDQWSITYRVHVEAAGESRAKATSTLILNGHADTYSSYAAWNAIYNTSYRPCYYHEYYRLKQAGFNNGYGHAMGIRLYSSWNYTTVANARTIKIDILKVDNCTFSFYDSMMKYAAIPGTGSTNYNTYTEFDFCNNGLQETGDIGNDTGYYILTNGFRGTAGTTYKIWRYSLFARTVDGVYESFTNINGTSTTKTKNPHGFLPEGKIYWNSASSDYSGTFSFSPYQQYHSIDYRYTFNIGTTSIPASANTYLKWTYNSEDRLLYLADEWFATTLPTVEDGFIYQRIGSNYYGSADYRASLLLDNPYYIYKNNKIRMWHPPGELLELNGIEIINASGTTPLTLSASKSGTTVTLTGSVAEATTSTAGVMAMSKANLNTMINQLDTGSSTPVDNDYYISQYVNGGTTTTTYHRRPMSTLYNYIKGKINVTNNTINLSRNTETTIATIAGTAIKIKLPASDNTDTKVTQNNNTTNADYRIILSGNANDTSETTTANKSTNLKFNPSSRILKVGGSIEATGDLDITGNANLHNQTYIDSLTANSLLVNGSANFVQIPTAPTPASTSNNTSVATTAFVNAWAGSNNITKIGTLSSGTVPWARLSGVPSSFTPSSHTHGNIQNGGTLQTNDITVASGDKLIVTDSSDSTKIARTSISFDGSTTTKALTPKGTWETFLQSHQSLSAYAKLASPALTGTPTAPTAAAGTNTTQIATTAFVMNAFTANDAMIFKGVLGTEDGMISNLPATHSQGWTYKVGTAGTYAGQICEVGDTIYCVIDGTSANNTHWVILQTNIDGYVIGQASSTAEHIAVFTGTTGKVIKDSGFTVGKSVPSNAVFTDTTYTFSDGTDGNFTVTPSTGTATTVSVGKPATAAVADKVMHKLIFGAGGAFVFDGSEDVTVPVYTGSIA